MSREQSVPAAAIDAAIAGDTSRLREALFTLTADELDQLGDACTTVRAVAHHVRSVSHGTKPHPVPHQRGASP